MARGYPDFTGPKVGVYLQPEWAAKEGVDKNFYSAKLGATWGQSVTITYDVPVGKTLYITDLSFTVKAANAEDADNNQIGYAYIYNSTTTDVIVTTGGNGGGSISLAKPAVIEAGETIQIALINYANHTVNLHLTALGYEI